MENTHKDPFKPALEDLGYNTALERFRTDQGLSSFDVGRVIAEHRERYVVKTADHLFDSEIIGNLRFTADSRYDLPAVGDWVACSPYEEGKALIHSVYPRHSILERKAVGKTAQIQIIGTNIDYALIVQAVDRDFNLNRLERYLTICHSAKVQPLVVLSKVDLIDSTELASLEEQTRARIIDVPIISVSHQKDGYKDLEAIIKKGKTYCLLGSSGVGKSTLINKISGNELMRTGEISASVKKGRHITSHRELHVLPEGGILIDNPGMREVGLSDVTTGLEITFETILELAQNCKFKDCTHIHEVGCAIIEAVEIGTIDLASYNNFNKMEKEKMHFETTEVERRRKDRALGKNV